MKKKGMDSRTLNLVTKISIVIAILLLIWFVYDAASSYSSGRCDSEIEFKKIVDCGEEQCEEQCAIQGFDGQLMDHKFTGRKMLISEINGEIIREEMCMCECSGCKER